MNSSEYVIKLNKLINEFSIEKEIISVLDAGCGSKQILNFGSKAFITGVDISQNQLERNKTVDEKILGDIQRIELPLSNFDIIVCWDVLEHLPSPEKAMKNFSRLIKKDGLIIIRVPNVISLKGLISKYTPFCFHKLVYKICKYKSTPFPTFLKWNISPKSLINFSKDNNLTIQWLYFDSSWIEMLKKKSFLLYTIYLGFGFILKILTFGNISISKTDFVIVYTKVNQGK